MSDLKEEIDNENIFDFAYDFFFGILYINHSILFDIFSTQYIRPNKFIQFILIFHKRFLY